MKPYLQYLFHLKLSNQYQHSVPNQVQKVQKQTQNKEIVPEDVMLANTVSNPHTMMIIHLHASPTNTTMH